MDKPIHPKNNTYYVTVGLIILALIIGIYYFVRIASNVSPQPVSTAHADWEVYTNPLNDFSIRYPSDFTLTPIPANAPSTTVAILAPVAYAYLNPEISKVADTQGLVINVSQADQCPNKSQDGTFSNHPTTFANNGVNFTVWSGGDAGMSQYYQSTYYDVEHTGRCYELSTVVHTVSLGVFDWTLAQQNAIDAERKVELARLASTTQEIVRTFQFTAAGN